MASKAEQSISSISFVINACYSYTFANALRYMVLEDVAMGFSVSNLGFDWSRLLCGSICLILTLRFFFGNNNFIVEIMTDQECGPWLRFYQFVCIVLQSIAILLSSFFVADPVYFVLVIGGLFVFEVVWYGLEFCIDRRVVWPDDRSERMAFFLAELTNFGFVAWILAGFWLFSSWGDLWLLYIFVGFILNTSYDLKVNMKSYMGHKSQA